MSRHAIEMLKELVRDFPGLIDGEEDVDGCDLVGFFNERQDMLKLLTGDRRKKRKGLPVYKWEYDTITLLYQGDATFVQVSADNGATWRCSDYNNLQEMLDEAADPENEVTLTKL